VLLQEEIGVPGETLAESKRKHSSTPVSIWS
jgi:hypothetical protein